MKRLLLFIFIATLLSCSRNEIISPTNTPTSNNNLKSINYKVEDKNRDGIYYTTRNYNFLLQYENNDVIKIYEPNNGFTENIIYSAGLIKDIIFSSTSFSNSISNYTHSRKLFYENNKLVRSEAPLDIYNNLDYKVYSYPDENKIYVTGYRKDSYGRISFLFENRIYFENENVVKIETLLRENEVNSYSLFEYDDKNNPFNKINKNRILAYPQFIYTIYLLRNYSLLSKNNVVKVTNYYNNRTYADTLLSEFNFDYEYVNNLPIKIWFIDYYEISDTKTTVNFEY